MLVANLAKEPGYPADFVAAYTANVVSMEENVKAVVAKIELGQGDAAIVLRHRCQGVDEGQDDRRARRRPTSRRRYAGVVVKASANAAAATGVPGTGWPARTGRPILATLRVPAARLVIDARPVTHAREPAASPAARSCPCGAVRGVPGAARSSRSSVARDRERRDRRLAAQASAVLGALGAEPARRPRSASS